MRQVEQLDLSVRRVARVGEDQLPVPLDDPAIAEAGGGPVEVDGVVREDLAEDGRPALDRGLVPQVDALHRRRGLEADGGEDRRGEVDREDGPIRDARSDLPRPADEDRRAEAAVVGRLLRARGEAVGVGVLDPAVVGEEDDDRVLGEPLLVEVVEELAAGLVEPLAHGPVLGHLRRLGLALVLVEEPRGGRVRRVRHHRGVPEEERLRPVRWPCR